MVPGVPVAVPVSKVIAPEFAVVPVEFPVEIAIASVVTLAVDEAGVAIVWTYIVPLAVELVSVNPSIVATVAPELIAVVPIVGAV